MGCSYPQPRGSHDERSRTSESEDRNSAREAKGGDRSAGEVRARYEQPIQPLESENAAAQKKTNAEGFHSQEQAASSRARVQQWATKTLPLSPIPLAFPLSPSFTSPNMTTIILWSSEAKWRWVAATGRPHFAKRFWGEGKGALCARQDFVGGNHLRGAPYQDVDTWKDALRGPEKRERQKAIGPGALLLTGPLAVGR